MSRVILAVASGASMYDFGKAIVNLYNLLMAPIRVAIDFRHEFEWINGSKTIALFHLLHSRHTVNCSSGLCFHNADAH